MFINLHKQSKSENDEELAKFCESILEVYEEYDINGHIEWNKNKTENE